MGNREGLEGFRVRWIGLEWLRGCSQFSSLKVELAVLVQVF